MTNFEILLSYLEKKFPHLKPALIEQRNDDAGNDTTVEESINEGEHPYWAIYSYVDILVGGRTEAEWDEVLRELDGADWSDLK